jgi:hypothetical protein
VIFGFLVVNSTIVDIKISIFLMFSRNSKNVMVSVRQSRTDMVRFVLDKRFFNVDKCKAPEAGDKSWI